MLLTTPTLFWTVSYGNIFVIGSDIPISEFVTFVSKNFLTLIYKYEICGVGQVKPPQPQAEAEAASFQVSDGRVRACAAAQVLSP